MQSIAQGTLCTDKLELEAVTAAAKANPVDVFHQIIIYAR